jgi:uncharacterized LabA/DUF88 family protein
MPVEPKVFRAIAFFDGQNLFHGAKAAFGYSFPNYDPKALAEAVCRSKGYQLAGIRFYTGIPDAADNAFWNHFWTAKLAALGYRHQTIDLPGGGSTTVLVGQEKGVDIRIALDVVHLAREDRFDVGIIFSQDQDLTEVATEVRAIAAAQNRWIKLISAFPSSPASTNRRGINGTDWFKIERAAYDTCIDQRDYRLKR